MGLRTLRTACAVALGALATLAARPVVWADAGGQGKAPLEDAQYAPARAFVATYCASCHSAGGTDPKHDRAYRAQRLDTYAEWRGHASAIAGVLDKWHLDGKIMPPPRAKAQPTDAERRLILAWIERGSPNSKTGK